MTLRLSKHSAGPEVPLPFQGKRFRSYVDMANFADKVGLPDGTYWIRNSAGTTFVTGMRELKRKGTFFHVEGRGYI